MTIHSFWVRVPLVLRLVVSVFPEQVERHIHIACNPVLTIGER